MCKCNPQLGQHLGRSVGGGGTDVEGVGPFPTSKVMASPHGT